MAAASTAAPAVSINTFFGDYLNGLWLTWKSAPTENTGTSDVEISFQANFRSRIHAFCYGCGYADDAAATAASFVMPTWTPEAFVRDSGTAWGTKITDYKNADPT